MRGACAKSELSSPVGIHARFASSSWASMPAVACSPAARPGLPFLARSRISSSLYGLAMAAAGRQKTRMKMGYSFAFIMVRGRDFLV